MAVRRYDIGDLRSPERTPHGYVRVDALPTRVGIFSYCNPDGSMRRELRLPEEVFHQDALKSFSLLPVTDDHPPVMLDAGNTKDFQRGHLGDDVRRDGDFVRASMLVTDADLIAKMEAGKHQLSCGYECELEMKAGTWNGQKYDAIQRNIRGNHVAVVEQGRAGAACSARMDSGDAAMLASDAFDTEKKPMKKIVIDGVEYEVTEQVAQAIAKTDAAHKAALDAVTARADAAENDLKFERSARKDAEDPGKLAALVQARVALVTMASKHLGDIKLDALSDQDIKLRVIEKLGGKVPTAKRDSVEYVDAYFSAKTDRADEEAGAKAIGDFAKAADEVASTEREDASDTISKARAAYHEKLRNLHKSIPADARTAK